MIRPHKMSIRPGNSLEGGGIIVFIYHRKASVQMWFPEAASSSYCVDASMEAWRLAMAEVVG